MSIRHRFTDGSERKPAISDEKTDGSDGIIAISVPVIAISDEIIAGSDEIVAGSDEIVAGSDQSTDGNGGIDASNDPVTDIIY